MGGTTVTSNAAAIGAQLLDVADALGDLRNAHTAAARLLEAAARPRIPVDTGRLARSGTPTVTDDTTTVAYPLPYAVPVHARDPWIPPAVDQVADQIVDLFRDEVIDLVRGIT